MFGELSNGLDIALAFIWSSFVTKKRELKARKIEIIKVQVFKVVNKIIEETSHILKEVSKIENSIDKGKNIKNVNHWKYIVLDLPNSFK